MANDNPASFHLRERVRVLLRLAQSAADVGVRGQVMVLVERLRARADEIDAQENPSDGAGAAKNSPPPDA